MFRKSSITETYWKDTARAALSLPPSPTPYLLPPTVSAFFGSLLFDFSKQASSNGAGDQDPRRSFSARQPSAPAGPIKTAELVLLKA